MDQNIRTDQAIERNRGARPIAARAAKRRSFIRTKAMIGPRPASRFIRTTEGLPSKS